MKVFVQTKRKILFIDCEPTDSMQDIKERVLLLSTAPGSQLQYCGQEVEYAKTLRDYNILHTGYVLKWV
uniref:Gsp-co-occurring protein 4 n=1 Tax=Malawimonas jakobiformis TaxID=136089 RepID=A0A895KR69_MALJA|nr:Gsp-co-occurring protein 4 [Malawimonas jakobiformis]